MGSGPQQTIDFVLSENVTRPTSPSCATENVIWRHLVAIVFCVQCTRQTAHGEQTIMALADRRRTCRPFQNRIGLDKFLGPTLGKIREAVEDVCLDLVLKTHTPVQLDVTVDSFAQHDLLSSGQGCAIC
jgi:hypothetical protein